jgi:threonine/homoserine/homoserine lactone efflux protein
MVVALLEGIALGFAAGISPGPLLGLVIARSLRSGWRAGVVVSFAPLFSDTPVVALALLVLSRLSAAALPVLSIAGGAFVIWLGIDTVRSAPHGAKIGDAPPPAHALRQAVATNLLNPHPYIFWGTVGAAVLARTSAGVGVPGVAAFLLGFYVLLVGSKIALALIVGASRGWLSGRGYTLVVTCSGLLLVGLGIVLAAQGIHSLA